MTIIKGIFKAPLILLFAFLCVILALPIILELIGAGFEGETPLFDWLMELSTKISRLWN